MAELLAGDGSSDDEEPEQVTFQRGREEAAQSQKREKQAVLREKALLKEKRRRREELFKEQKKRKLLPLEILEEVAAQPQSSKQNETSSKQEKGKDAESSKSGDQMSKEEQGEEELASTRVNANYKAMRLKDQDKSSIQQQTAKNFIHDRLYGPGTRRTTVTQFFSVASKKGAIKKPAVNFVNNAWGKEKKQRAKRFKSRWVNKQMPPT